MFDSLATAIELPNIDPPTPKPTAAIRFPVPPKSTREMVAEAFGYDPSLRPQDMMRNINQAMLLMNNEQLQAQAERRGLWADTGIAKRAELLVKTWRREKR